MYKISIQMLTYDNSIINIGYQGINYRDCYES